MRNLSTPVKVALGIATFFVVAICFSCMFGLILSLFVEAPSPAKPVVDAEHPKAEEARLVWKNQSYDTTFYYRQGDAWEEFNGSGELERDVRELSRNETYIEVLLLDRQHRMRLYEHHADIFKDSRWQWVSDGNWQRDEVAAPKDVVPAQTAVKDSPKRDKTPSASVDLPKRGVSPQQPKFVMPSYTILDTIKRLDGNTQVEALVPSYNRDTTLEFVTEAAKQIAEKNNANVVLLFATTEAQKAVYSDTFSRNNTGASDGYLGRWTMDGFKKVDD